MLAKKIGIAFPSPEDDRRIAKVAKKTLIVAVVVFSLRVVGLILKWIDERKQKLDEDRSTENNGA